jgi:sugar phosphate isomerase/epimerase
MLDTWHWLRGGGTLADVKALPGARVGAVQLSDAPAQAEGDPVEETLKRRRLPGLGDADLVGLVRALDEAGSRAPIGVEVFSDELAARPVGEIARRCAEATRAVLREARG